MARRLLTAVTILLGLLALALPAQAKGEGGKITISGGGGPGTGGGGIGGGTGGGGNSAAGGGGTGATLLSSPIHLNGRASAFWFDETGFGQAKFDRALSMGKPLPKSQLGPALAVTASFLCGPGERRAVQQVLYPYARGGPQVYTPANQFMCGMDLRKGWWPATYGQMFDTLVAHGLPKTLPAASRPVNDAAGGTAAQAATSGISTWPLVLAGVVALAVLLLSAAVVQRRRVRLPA